MGNQNWEEAIKEFRIAIRLDSKNVVPHRYLTRLLSETGDLDGAVREARIAVQIDPNSGHHYILGTTLMGKGLLDEAITEFREAIRLNKEGAEAYCNLGHTLMRKGQFQQAVEEFRRGHEIGSRNPGWPYPSIQWLRNAEKLAQLEPRLPEFLRGETQATDTGERLALALLCQEYKKFNAAAARFYGEAFAADSKLAEDLRASHRYNAACVAALAGCGQGKDVGELDGKERERLRRQALAWLRADLAAWKQPSKESDKTRPTVQQTMQHWQHDEDLAGVRGEALAKLPEAEGKEWQRLWQEVEELGKRAAQEKHP
jgi:serine/threonine-protein kinase